MSEESAADYLIPGVRGYTGMNLTRGPCFPLTAQLAACYSGKGVSRVPSYLLRQAVEDYEELERIAEERWEDAQIGRWFREVFTCRFMDGNLPGPKDVLIGSRLRVQIDNPEGDWVDWRKP